MNEGQEIPCGLLAAPGDAFKTLDALGRPFRAEFADGLLDTSASLVKGFREEGGLGLGICLVRNDRRDAALRAALQLERFTVA